MLHHHQMCKILYIWNEFFTSVYFMKEYLYTFIVFISVCENSAAFELSVF